jgi:phosphoserine phosphatase
MRVAFLDLDHTLLSADSNQLWMDLLHSQQLITAADVQQHERFMDDYANGVLDFEALQSFRIGLDASLPPLRLAASRASFERDVLLPALAPLAPALLSDLRAQGLSTVIVSATRASLVEPVARHLGVDHVIAACFGRQKVQAVESWLKSQGSSLSQLEQSWFYSDSHNDLPLLEAVANPVAVDPDPRLAQLARDRGWPEISLQLEPLCI